MPKIPLGGSERNYDSKKSRERVVNMMAESNADGSFRVIRRTEGLTQFVAFDRNPVRSNSLINGGYIYAVAGSHLYRTDKFAASSDLGEVGGVGRAQILANSVPGNNQIVVLNGSGQGYIYDNSGLTQITDPDFFPTVSGAVLDERFWFVRKDSNEVFASDISDGFSYNPLSFFTAEESPDLAVRVLAKQSAIWVIGESTMEYHQSFTDTTVPLRKVKSATVQRGIIAPDSLASAGENFAFLADDLTVLLIRGAEAEVISDLELHLKIRGNGTSIFPGFSFIADAQGFFIDGPAHKIYCLTFPLEGYTWCYDLKTGMSHSRESDGLGYWRAMSSALFDTNILVGDRELGKLWKLDPKSATEGGAVLRSKFATVSLSFETDVTIPMIELDMEVGQIDNPSVEPMLMVRFSRDGGFNWINHSDVSLGTKGNYRKRIVLRRFGRLVRNKEFIMELIVTDAARVQYYGAWANIQEDA